LLQPFARRSGRSNRAGHGLGLYIAAQIAHAHGGTLDVDSTPEETRVTFSMPLG
jgi:signal transduction histidine kinase